MMELMRWGRIWAGVVLTVSISGTVAGAAGRDAGLPNPVTTPGALNAKVTQANVLSTICVDGYSKSIRPPFWYTEPIKIHQLDSGYNLHGDTRLSHYEEDHLIPLELGGSPTSVKNLWPQPRYIVWGAARKDAFENRMHELVCSGVVSLALAQRLFATNWIAGYQRYYASSPRMRSLAIATTCISSVPA